MKTAPYITLGCDRTRPTFESALAKPGDWAWQSWHAKPDAIVDEPPTLAPVPDEPPTLAPVPDEAAKPCPTCGAWFLWQTHDGERHCVECVEPPKPRAIAKIIQCEVVDGRRCAVDVTAICFPLWVKRLHVSRSSRVSP